MAAQLTMMNGRGELAGIVLAGVVLAGAVGWFAGTQIRSPAEVASRTSAPAAAPVLVPAEERVLSTDIVTRGLPASGPLSSFPSHLPASRRAPVSLLASRSPERNSKRVMSSSLPPAAPSSC